MSVVPCRWLALAVLASVTSFVSGARAQDRPDPAELVAQQRAAMKTLAAFDGIWRGPARMVGPGGEKREVIATERVGLLLDGSVRVLEGGRYALDGRPASRAFGMISYDVSRNAYWFHSYAQGAVGDYPVTPTTDGYLWSIPAGPQTIRRYISVIRNGEWYEVGDRIVGGDAPVRFFEMHLKRVGNTTWPAGDPVPLR